MQKTPRRRAHAAVLGLAVAVFVHLFPGLHAGQASVLLAQQGQGVDDEQGASENNLIIPAGKPLYLLQPLDDQTSSLNASPGIQIFFDYFNLGWPWLIGSAAGIAVLWSLVGGMQVILSGGDPGKRQAGIDRLLWSLAGLAILALAGLILRTLNPLFYK